MTEPDPAAGAPPIEAERPRAPWRDRLFGSRLYFRLWCAQVVSSLGDWIGFLAIAAAAARIGGGSPEAAVGLVMAARVAPGFFLGPVLGVFVDRWDRKAVMVTADLGRAATLALLPFITHVWQLLIASLVMEIFTLMWAPAKEASVPNLVPPGQLARVNSLSLIAAYGTFPIASGLFAALAKVAEALSDLDVLDWLSLSQESVAFWVDSATFAISAIIIWRLALPSQSRRQRESAHEGDDASLGSPLAELREGWRHIFINPVVRAVNLGLATALIGGAMVVPLGPVFSSEVLGAGSAGFGLLTTALGVGMAFGVVLISVLQRRLHQAAVFSGAVLVAGVTLVVASMVSALSAAMALTGVMGVCSGAAYVLGFTLLHENVDDDLRGRVFSGLYTMVRLCVLLAFTVGPFMSGLLDSVSEAVFDDSRFEVAGVTVFVPGVRLTLLLGGLIIIGAWVIVSRALRQAERTGVLSYRAEGPVLAGPAVDQPEVSR